MLKANCPRQRTSQASTDGEDGSERRHRSCGNAKPMIMWAKSGDVDVILRMLPRRLVAVVTVIVSSWVDTRFVFLQYA